MNWGIRIVIGMGLAMTAVVSAGIYMVSHNQDTLEESDYYEKGIHYDAEYHKKENVVMDHSKPVLHIVRDSLSLHFTEPQNQGTIYLKRPSDRTLDSTWAFSTQRAQYGFSLASLHRGAWQLRITWEHGGKSYLQDETFFLP